jgi:hypothetical protein
MVASGGAPALDGDSDLQGRGRLGETHGNAGQTALHCCKLYLTTARGCFLRKEVIAADCVSGGDSAMRSAARW